MTAATGDMVDDKDEAMKPELQLDVDLDIRGPDIRDLDLDIRGPDIRDFDFSGLDRDLDLDIVDLDVDLDIRGPDFSGLDIRGLDISDLDFSGLDMDLDVDLDIRGLDIRDIDFRGLDLDKADSGVLNAIERRDAILGQRLATAVYLTSGGLAVVHMATFGVVMTLAG